MKVENGKFGYLAMCADRRFHAKAEEEFRKLTGLSENGYWIEARAGGASGITDYTTADYAYQHGARLMGWANHGSGCGGFPGFSDEEMRQKIEEVAKNRKERYPEAVHFKIFSTEEEGTRGEKVD